MKHTIFTGWSVSRVLFLLLGIAIIIQSAIEKQWMGILFGGYFASMGLFAFGCAANNCFAGNNCKEPRQNLETKNQASEIQKTTNS